MRGSSQDDPSHHIATRGDRRSTVKNGPQLTQPFEKLVRNTRAQARIMGRKQHDVDDTSPNRVHDRDSRCPLSTREKENRKSTKWRLIETGKGIRSKITVKKMKE